MTGKRNLILEVNEQIFPTTSLWLTIGTIIFMFWTEESLVYNIFWIWKHQRFNWNVYWRKNICWWIGRETNHCDKTFKMVYIVFCKYMKSIMFNIILKIYPARLVSCIIICCLDCWIHERIFCNLYKSSFFIYSVCKNVSKQKSLKN